MIELQNVSFGYRRKKALFSGLSMELAPGRIYGLLGSNGVGKTTLLKLVAGLLRPCEGAVSVMGQSPGQRRPSLYRELFFIPEEFDLPGITFRTFARTTAPFYPDFSPLDLDRHCSVLGVDPDVRLDAVSMGQKKRALIAFALACNVRLLLMDEPTNGLDIPAKAAFRSLVSGYADESRTVVISTHQVRDVDSLIDHVIVLDERGLLLSETVERIASRLCFGAVGSGDSPLFGEDSLQGRRGVTENLSGVESKVDLELLFNASIRNPERMQAIFKRSSPQP